MAINVQTIQGEWSHLCSLARQRWNQLTEDDLRVQEGNIEQLVGRIQQKTGEGREAIEKFLGDLTSRGAGTVSQVAESAREYMQQAREFAAGAGDRLREGYGQVGDMARQRYEMAEDVVRRNPGQSVAAAFGFGLVLGVVVGLALRSR